MKHHIHIQGLDRLPEAAEEFLKLAGHIPLLAFSGDMGAGKTTFIQAVCKALGVPGEVVSPTFALVNEYLTPDGRTIFHFDLYRIEDEEEMYDLGYEEYFYSGHTCLIEWPEKAGQLLPEEVLMIHISEAPDGSRELDFELP